MAWGWLGFILHLSRRTSPHRSLEGAQLSAVPVLQGGVFTRPGPKRAGVSCRLERILGPAWGPLPPQEVTLRLPSEAGDCESPTLRTGISETPVRIFHFQLSVSLFQKGTAGVNYDRFQGFEDYISCTPIARPLQTHMSLWEQ